MPINLPDPKVQYLLKKSKEVLPQLKVTNGMILHAYSSAPLFLLEAQLPKKGTELKKAHEYIGEYPLYNYYMSEISRLLSFIGVYDENPEAVKLPNVPKFSNIDELSIKLLNGFLELPNNYEFFVKLPEYISNIIPATFDNFHLCDSIYIFKPDEAHAKKYKTGTGDKKIDDKIWNTHLLAIGDQKNEWEFNSFYLSVSIDGYSEYYGNSIIHDKIAEVIKTIFGFFIAHDLIKFDKKYDSFYSQMSRIVFRRYEQKWVIDNTHKLDKELSETIHSLALADWNGRRDDTKGYDKHIGHCLWLLKSIFSKDDMSDRVCRACQWYFDSYTGTNQLLSFLQATITIEILLGEKNKEILKKIGLTELLKNRCAYLVGKDHNSRNEIMEDFDKIYDVRSEIVHKGHSKLSSEQSILFDKLRKFCSKVIREETQLIHKCKE